MHQPLCPQSLLFLDRFHTDSGICMQLNGGSLMKIRTDDPLYLNHVDRFWGHLLPRLSPLTYQNGGPIVMVQVRPWDGLALKYCRL